MTSKAVENTPKGSTAVAVPAMIQPALEIEASDIQLPRLYIGQYSSKAVKNKHVDVQAGDIFLAQGADDPEPIVLFREGDPSDTGPVIYVLGMYRGKSYSEEGGELELYAYDDPAAPEKAWVTYNYTLAIPSVDEDVPVKWLCTKTAKGAATKINTTLMKNSAKGPAWLNAFRLSTAGRSNPKGDYFVPMSTNVEVDPDHVDIAEALAVLVAGQPAVTFDSTTEEPSI